MTFQARTGPMAVVWFAAVAAFGLAVPLVLAALQALWQWQIPPAQQPRLFAGRNSLEACSRLVGLLGISALADRVLPPALWWPHWPSWLPAVLGTGAGRPVAMALGLLGWIMILPVLTQWRSLGRIGRAEA
jgi:hypothetical protein